MMRSKITRLIKECFYYSGLVSAARVKQGPTGEFPILRYHAVSRSADYCPSSIALSPELFDSQMAYVAKHYNVLHLDEITSKISKGQTLPKNCTAITFDDGYLDNYENAFPVLKKYGLTATFFITAGPVLQNQRFWVGWLQRAIMRQKNIETIIALVEAFDAPASVLTLSRKGFRQPLIDHISVLINRSNLAQKEILLNKVDALLPTPLQNNDDTNFMMKPNHLVEMHSVGMNIGSHTITHPILSSLEGNDLERELMGSKAMLEEAIQDEVKHIAFPNGPGVKNFNDKTSGAARNAGYTSCHTSERGTINLGSNLFAMNRQGVNHELSIGAFAFKLEEHKFGPLLMG